MSGMAVARTFRLQEWLTGLVGIITPGAKVPALLNNRVLYRDGIAIATQIAGDIQWIENLGPAEARAAEDALVKRQAGSPLLAYLR